MPRIAQRLVPALLFVGLAIPPVHADPSILLFGATIESARALAMDSATERGWSLAIDDLHGVTFEQVLEEADLWDGTPMKLIRIHARFVEEAFGARVALRAEEIEAPESAEEWIYDVTARYAENLEYALSKLQARWDASHPDAATRGSTDQRAPELPGVGTRPSSIAPDSSTLGVGEWAYYAERYAESRGCLLTDQGAILDAAGQGWEHHRIACQDGSVILVACYYGECTAGR